MSKTETTRAMEKTITLNAPIERVWAALTEAEALEQWFPVKAKSSPGVGGEIWYSWGEVFEGACRIEVWEPPRHLRTTWMESPGADSPPASLVVDYYLESLGDNETALRLVHAGFGADADWNWLYDAVDTGWDFELRSLQRAMRAAPHQRRKLARVNAEITGEPADVWNRLFDSGLATLSTRPSSLSRGDDYRLVIGDLKLKGQVIRSGAQILSGRVANMNDGLFYMCVEACGGRPMLVFWLATWGVEQDKVDAAQRAFEHAVRKAAE